MNTTTTYPQPQIKVGATYTIQGRAYKATLGERPYDTAIATYAEVILTGVRGASYFSERIRSSNVFRFWRMSSRRYSLPTLAFEDPQFFTIENGEIRRATYGEVKAAYAGAAA